MNLNETRKNDILKIQKNKKQKNGQKTTTTPKMGKKHNNPKKRDGLQRERITAASLIPIYIQRCGRAGQQPEPERNDP